MKLYRAIVVLLMIGLPATSFALEPGFYIGGSFGNTEADTGVEAVTSGISIDEKDSGFKLLLGNKISDNVAIEVAYVDLGEASITGDAGDIFRVDGVLLQFLVNNARLGVEASALAFSGLFIADVSDSASIFGRVGLSMWDLEATASAGGVSVGSVSDDGTDIFFGAGVQFDMSPSLGLRVEYEIYDLDSDDVSMLSAGVVARF